MKPVYSNYFVVRNNDVNTEVLIDFIHTYAGVKPEIVAKVEGDLVTPRVELRSETVSSLILNVRDAMALKDTLDKVLQGIIKS